VRYENQREIDEIKKLAALIPIGIHAIVFSSAMLTVYQIAYSPAFP